jgi:DNA invertase Pin-like site-specific DNA recombinase
MRVAIYVRVSTAEQSVEMQLNDLRKYAEARGHAIVAEYKDEGVSGAKENRPALDKLMKAAFLKEFDAVLVWKFDRFARSTKHLVTALDTFNNYGIGFISLHEQIDTTSPMGKAMFTIIAAMATLERDTIIERVNAGIKNAKAKGVVFGRRPMPPLVVSQVKRLKSEGLSVRKIAAKVGWSKTAVAAHLAS